MKNFPRFFVAILLIFFFAGSGAAQDWLQWGGSSSDFNIASQNIAQKWPGGQPKQLWKRTLGEGYSSILYKDGKLFTQTSDGEEECVIALDAQTGKTLWEHRYVREFWEDMRLSFGPGPNATPLIVGNRIMTIGIAGEMRCLSLDSGDLIWKRDLNLEYGRRKRMEEYGYSASPLFYQDKIIVQVGGDDHGVIAVNPQDGSTLWEAAPGGISYAQASIIHLAGRDQFIYFSPEGVNGLDPLTGELLWHWKIPVDNGNHLTPIVQCDANRIWVSSQFNSGGGRLLEITNGQNSMNVKELWFDKKLRGSCWTTIRIGDYIYGSAGGHQRSEFTALNWKTKKIIWQRKKFHMAQCLHADGKFIILDRDGGLSLVKVSPRGFNTLESTQVTESPSWTPPTLVNTTLYVRDRKSIMALDLAEGH